MYKRKSYIAKKSRVRVELCHIQRNDDKVHIIAKKEEKVGLDRWVDRRLVCHLIRMLLHIKTSYYSQLLPYHVSTRH